MIKNNVVYEGSYSKVVHIFDKLYFREGNLEVRDQCNCGFLVLDSCVAIIDYPAQNPDHEIIDEAEHITGLPVKYILVTHAHVDHVAG
ncbi:MAG: MBL fold metallo-hydrolase [Anaerolineae bacterium]|nr:MBL fold metallo-hydrolase [Anaerolineae bacterium]